MPHATCHMPHAQTWRHSLLTAASSQCNHRLRDTVSYPVGKDKTSTMKTPVGCSTYWRGLCVSGRPRGSRGAVHRSTTRTSFKLLHGSTPLQSEFPRRGSDAHHVTSADGLEFLPPRETFSLAHVTAEGSRPVGFSRCFNLRIWPEDQNGGTCPPRPPFLINVFS